MEEKKKHPAKLISFIFMYFDDNFMLFNNQDFLECLHLVYLSEFEIKNIIVK